MWDHPCLLVLLLIVGFGAYQALGILWDRLREAHHEQRSSANAVKFKAKRR